MVIATKVLSWLRIIPAPIHIGPRSSMGMPYGDGDAHGYGRIGNGGGRGDDYGDFVGDGTGRSWSTEGSGYGELDGSGVQQTTPLLY